jgi:protease PrsW
MQLYIISFLVTIIFWLWIIMKYDKFEHEPLKVILFVFLIGGLISSIPAGILNSLFLYFTHYYDDEVSGYFVNEKSNLFYGFAGINEEFFKAAAAIILVRKIKGFNEPADALVYAMTVAFGFAVMENIEYITRFGLTTFLLRQFNAVPLHIGLAAIWGIGMAKAKFLHQGKYLQTVTPYLLIAAFVHSVYNLTTTVIHGSVLIFLILTLFAMFLIIFAIRKVKRYSEDGPFSNRLFCHHCNTINFPWEKCCKKCGHKFDLEFYMLCPDCNMKVIQNASSCPNCGTKLGMEATNTVNNT